MTETKDADDDGFIRAVAPAVACLEHLATAYLQMNGRYGHTPAADSKAMAEIAAAQSNPPWTWQDPVTEAHTAAGLLVFAGIDHLRAYAHLFTSPPVPVYSHLTNTRAAVEAFGWALWLADPGISMESRVKRGQVHILVDTLERERFPSPEMKQLAKVILARVRTGAPDSWTVICNPSQVRVADVRLPRSKDVIGAALGNMPKEAGPDDTTAALWSMLSGTGHGIRYALALPIGEPLPATALGSLIVPLGTRSSTVHLIAATIARSAINSAGAYFNLMGWDADTEWQAAVDHAEQYIANVIRAVS